MPGIGLSYAASQAAHLFGPPLKPPEAHAKSVRVDHLLKGSYKRCYKGSILATLRVLLGGSWVVIISVVIGATSRVIIVITDEGTCNNTYNYP